MDKNKVKIIELQSEHRRGVLAALASFYQDRPHQRRTRKAGKGVIAR